MAKLATPSVIDQILESMRMLGEADQRTLAAAVLNDRRLEPFVEELDDQLTCETAADEGTGDPFSMRELDDT
ncbi:MAG TPA: hypothetical protein VJM12_20600 [Pyrinomonadaceae bacterium]|nr:hypothetical protein [Pyrinomonadaceae bacterium]